MEIGLAIYNILSTDTNVAAIVSTRIYPNVAKQTSDFPFIVYQMTGVTPTDTKGGAVSTSIALEGATSPLDTNTFDVSCFSENYAGAVSLAEKVRNALDRNTGTHATIKIQGLSFVSSNEYFDIKGEGEGIYVHDLTFNLRQAEPVIV